MNKVSLSLRTLAHNLTGDTKIWLDIILSSNAETQRKCIQRETKKE
jgi:hypothetical protein